MDKDRFVPVPDDNVADSDYGRRIGDILVRAGRLTKNDVERILHSQSGRDISFGDAAIDLGLLTASDIQFAISRQFDHQHLVPGQSKVSERVVTAYATSGPHLEAMRSLRNELMLRWFDNENRNALAIVSGQPGEGRSFIASNLAVMFSLLGQHTLLIDADMRNPRQHELFGLDNRAGLSALLSGRGGLDTIKRIPGLDDLSVLPAGVLPPNPAELLAKPEFTKLLNEMRAEFDVILLDSPPAARYADAQTIAVRAVGVLIVARKNVTRMWRVRGVSESVTKASAAVIGTVLNEF